MRRIFAKTAGAALLGVLNPAAGLAADTHESARAIIETIDEATLREALLALGAQATPLDEEGRVVRVGFPGGGVAVLRRSACEEGPCRGLLMTSLFAPPKASETDTAARIARRFSSSFNPASVIINERGEHLLKAYLVLDGGVTRANLVTAIGLFGLGIAQYSEALYGAAE
ncbi:Putative sensory transduction regulator [Erythrobacter litoralis]|uniref:YbjN domain-containing protein n=1 Tax=Erythrobacter litoralis TaxID=39960 RepID=A0A074MI19_9SPHN|nr:YbjN domain-containing protein [Erythrobacter litoralis]AOL23375.1 Putative sensory transduction regulator [Erythrobacter litoralis]KEO92480.1 hypothetical protein EH32_14565 [Erythrobacter litoralis]